MINFLSAYGFCAFSPPLSSRITPSMIMLTLANCTSATVSISTFCFRATSKLFSSLSHFSPPSTSTLTFFSGREDGPATWPPSELPSESEIEITDGERRRFPLLVATSCFPGSVWGLPLFSNLRNEQPRLFCRHIRHWSKYFSC